MKIIFIGILMLMLIITVLSFMITNIKANIKLITNAILLQKSFNYLLSTLAYLLAIDIIFITNNIIIYVISSFLSIFVYVCILLYNTKWNHYELETNKMVAERLLRDCTNFQEKDFVNFKKNMSRADQIRWLKSLTYIDKETSEELHEDGTKTTITTEKIVPLIEGDEDLKDFDCFLKKV